MRDIVFAILIFGLIPFILWRPWIGIPAWYWVGLMNPHRLAWGFLQTLPVAMAIGLTTLVALLLAKDRRPLPLTRETVLMGLLVLHMTAVTFLFAWFPEMTFDRWEKVMKILLMTFVAPMLVFGKQRTMMLLAVITLSIGYFGLKGGIYTLQTGFGGMVLGPRSSFIFGNTDIGLAMLMTLPLLFVLARQVYQGRFELPFSSRLYERWHRLAGMGLYAAFSLQIVAIIGTHSRGAWLGLVVVVALLFFAMRHRLTLVAMGLTAVFVVGFSVPDKVEHQIDTLINYEEDASAGGRFDAWSVAWNISLDAPLTGSGLGTQRLPPEIWLSYLDRPNPTIGRPIAAHSIYFQVLGNHGFLGISLYLALIGFTLITLMRLFRDGRRHVETVWISEWSGAIFLGLIGFCISGSFLSLAYFDLFFVLVALAIILRRELKEAEASSVAGQIGLAPRGATSVRMPGSL